MAILAQNPSMRSFLTLLCLGPAIWSAGQPVITNADLPVVGTSFSLQVGDWAAQPQVGPDCVWTYPGNGAGTIANMTVSQASTSDWAATFPEATLVMTGDGNSVFMSTGENGLYSHGHANFFTQLVMNDPLLQVEYPLDMSSEWESTFSGQQGSILFTGSSESAAVGHGTLVLPWGSVEDVLRLRLVSNTLYFTSPQTIQIDTVDVYYKAGFPWYVARATKRRNIQGGVAQPFQYSLVYATQNSVVGVDEAMVDDNALHLFPNPASDIVVVNVATDGHASRLEVLDASGRTIHSEGLPSSAAGKLEWRLDASRWTSGLYIVRVYDGLRPAAQRKLMVQ